MHILKNRVKDDVFLANDPSDLSLLAFGIPPAREAESAGGMPKVPKGQGLGPLVCSACLIFDGQPT